MQLVVLVTRDPHTRKFWFEAATRSDWSALEPDFDRHMSPTRFAYTFTSLLNKAMGHFEAYVLQRWDDALALDVVDAGEAATLLERPKES